MIGKLKGSITEFFGQEALLETSGGVSYRLFVPTRFRSQPLPCQAELYTILHVRDDAMVLYGFQDRQELDLFQLFNGVSGVGPKTAYMITIAVDLDQLHTAVRTSDVSYLTKIPGLGKKTAMKILLELSSKMKQEFQIPQEEMSESDRTLSEALRSLGFTASDVAKVLPQIDKTKPLEDQITQGIQRLSS